MSDQDKIYFSATDPGGRNIDLHKSTWDHIKERHPEVKRPTEVKSTIQNPHFIIERTERKSLIYTQETRLDLFFNVVAKMDDTYLSGSVATAHLSKRMLTGDTIWTRKK